MLRTDREVERAVRAANSLNDKQSATIGWRIGNFHNYQFGQSHPELRPSVPRGE
jgi:hypothetical protein